MSLTPILQKDTMLTKIFVGGLPYHTTDDTLRQFFEQFGEIEEAVVITDRQSGKSRGYGFVTMSDREYAELACKQPNPIIDGRKANVNLAYLGAKPRGNIPSGFPFQLKTGLQSIIPTYSQYGYPQIYYTSPYLPTSSPNMMAMQQPSSLSPANTCQYLDYATTPYMNAMNAAHSQMSQYDAATVQYANAINQGYTYAVPQQLAVHPSQLQNLQYPPQQQLQERMQ